MIRHLFIFLSVLSSLTCYANNGIRIPVSFGEIERSTDSRGTHLSIHGLLNTMEAGLPSVPVKTLKIAIPNGKAFESLTWEESGRSREVLANPVFLSSGQAPISWIGNPPKGLVRAVAPSIQGDFFPKNSYEISPQRLHGVDVLMINLYPVQVGKDLKSIATNKGGFLQIHLKDKETEMRTLFKHQLEEVEAFIDNPEVMESFRGQLNREKVDYDYLIISTADLIAYKGENGFQALQDSLKSRGLISRLKDVKEISKSVRGEDLVEKIRNYIKQEYSQAGIRYVLFAGEGRESEKIYIPARKLWAKVKAYFGGATGWTDVELDIPADSYFACLDGEFNGNGNSHWGETDDGPNGGDVDFLAEITTGRTVLKNTTDLQNFVRKTVEFAKNGVSPNVILLGELLFKEKDLYGDEYMEQLLGNVDEHGFQTSGYGSQWKATRFYDRKNKWTGVSAQNDINKNEYGMVNHLGHSSNTLNMRLNSASISRFTNAKPFVYYTQGCYAAGYNTGSFVDLLITAKNAAVAAVGNTVYGLAPEDPQPELTKTPGGSQMLHRVFIHNLMNHAKKSFGAAHTASKEFFIGLKNAQEVRWVNWTATYFGDPSLTM